MREPVEIVRAVFVCGGKALLILEDFGIEGKFWVPPGGKVERSETLKDALSRELKEEIGLDQAGLDKIGATLRRYLVEIGPGFRDTQIEVTHFLAEIDQEFRPQLLDNQLKFDWFGRMPPPNVGEITERLFRRLETDGYM